MNFQIFVIFHKTLYKEFYEMPEHVFRKSITCVAVNDHVKVIPPFFESSILKESQLTEHFVPELQKLQYHESSVWIHLSSSPLLCAYKYVGCLHYDMRITEKTIESLNSLISTKESCLFFFKCHKLDENVYNSFGSVKQGIETFSYIIDLYNKTFDKSHELQKIIHHYIPMYHSYVMPSKILRVLGPFIQQLAVPILQFLGGTRHLPYHLDRIWGLCLLLKQLDGELLFIPLNDVTHEDSVKEPKFHH